MTARIRVRSAREADVPSIEALMRPEIAAGSLLPREVRASDFLVAEDASRTLVGCVGLADLGPGMVELGSLVAVTRGVGLGGRLVYAALDRAARTGCTSVMALTAIPGFFERFGFTVASDRPWLRARRELGMSAAIPLHATTAERQAAASKASACVGCARLLGCRQVMLTRRVGAVRRAHA